MSAYAYAAAYVALYPLLFLAVNGSFSFDLKDFNNPLMGVNAPLVAVAGNSWSHKIEIVACYAAIALLLFANLKSVARGLRGHIAIMALPLLAIASMLWSQDWKQTAVFSMFLAISTVFAVFLSRRFSPEQQMQVIVLTCLLAVVGSILMVAFMPSTGIDGKTRLGGWQGLFPHKNVCALQLVLLASPLLTKSTSTSRDKVLRVSLMLLAFGVIVMTTSRTGWIVFGLTLAFNRSLTFLKHWQRADRVIGAMAGILLTAVLVYAAVSNYQMILPLLGKDQTLTGRTQIWHAVVVSAAKRPLLGYGYDAFWLNGLKGEAVNTALATGYVALGNAENGVLQVWLDLGLVGVGLLLVMLYRSTKNGLACLSHRSPPYINWYLTIIFFTLLSLVDGNKFIAPNSIEWPLFVIAYCGLSVEAKRCAQQ